MLDRRSQGKKSTPSSRGEASAKELWELRDKLLVELDHPQAQLQGRTRRSQGLAVGSVPGTVLGLWAKTWGHKEDLWDLPPREPAPGALTAKPIGSS